MSLEIQGKVVQVLQEISGESKNGRWVKQEFILETAEDRFPKKVCFSAWGDKADLVKTLKQGESISVSFNPESREFKGRWYTELRAWKIEKGATGATGDDVPPPFTSDDIPPPEEEDLPF